MYKELAPEPLNTPLFYRNLRVLMVYLSWYSIAVHCIKRGSADKSFVSDCVFSSVWRVLVYVCETWTFEGIKRHRII